MYQIDPDIYYVLIVPDWDPYEATLLQGFAPSLCRNSWMFTTASILPANIFDLTPDGHETFLARRMSGQYPIHVHPQSPRAARAMPLPPFVPFTLYVLPEQENLADYADWIDQCPVPPTFVTRSGGDLTYEHLTVEGLKSAFLSKLDRMPDDVDPDSIEVMRQALSEWAPMPEAKLDFQLKEHGSVRPNVAALTAAGYVDILTGRFDDFQEAWAPYVDQIVRASTAILDKRDQVGERDIQRIYRTPPDINLYAPSIYPHFFDLPVPPNYTPEQKRRFRLTRDILRTQAGYSFTVSSNARQQALLGIDQSENARPQPHFLMRMRAEEVNLGTAVMCTLAASEFSVVLRLPNDINRTSGTIRSFAEHYRSHAPSSRKRLLAFREVQSRLNAAFPAEFRDIVRRSQSGIRIVSDAHLEWLDLDGLPLMLRRTCSRVPVTPGNLFVSQAGAQDIVHLTPGDLRKILVHSALKPDDPIAGLFDLAFEVFSKRWEGKLDIATVAVASEDDLVNAINAFEGYLMIFDGHGGHGENEAGKLYLQDTAIDVWSLRPKLNRVPPIVILSACDTHAAARNHATTANGFLSLGARAVLGSVFPIDARTASIFTARFLYRVADYLEPAIGMFGHGLRWSDVVSGMLKMQILTDFLRTLLQMKLIDDEQYRHVHVEGNKAINSDQDDPFGQVIAMMEKLGHERAALLRELEAVIANSDVISYLHVGRPETILIDDTGRVAAQLQEIATRTDDESDIRAATPTE